MLIATIQFDDPSQPEVGNAMSLLSSLRCEPATRASPVPAAPGGPFTFTVPQSRVIVKVSDPMLRADDAARAGASYFKLARRDPQLILNGWLDPTSRQKGLQGFWESEGRGPAYAGANPGCSGAIRGRWLPFDVAWWRRQRSSARRVRPRRSEVAAAPTDRQRHLVAVLGHPDFLARNDTDELRSLRTPERWCDHGSVQLCAVDSGGALSNRLDGPALHRVH